MDKTPVTVVSYGVMVWFFLSVVAAIVFRLLLVGWLRRRNVISMFNILAGTPGYSEFLYINWCKANNRPDRTVIWISLALLVNLAISGIIFVTAVKS